MFLNDEFKDDMKDYIKIGFRAIWIGIAWTAHGIWQLFLGACSIAGDCWEEFGDMIDMDIDYNSDDSDFGCDD